MKRVGIVLAKKLKTRKGNGGPCKGGHQNVPGGEGTSVHTPLPKMGSLMWGKKKREKHVVEGEKEKQKGQRGS